jgi:Domain of unknown function (DUF4372)
MVKSKHFSGQHILGQLLLLVSKTSVSKLAKQHGSDHYVKRFTTYKHLVVMLFATLEGCGSLREVVLGLLVNGRRLVHIGLGEAVGRSTLSDANRRRPSMVFAARSKGSSTGATAPSYRTAGVEVWTCCGFSSWTPRPSPCSRTSSNGPAAHLLMGGARGRSRPTRSYVPMSTCPA